ncbi:MAG: Smr/MutS family protein [bacterium]|nr:Smr/MutS family protein [bacterium]
MSKTDNQAQQPLVIGQLVTIRGFRQKFTLVTTPSNKGTVKVSSGSITMTVKRQDITSTSEPKVGQKKVKSSLPSAFLPPQTSSSITIDLHGLTVAQALAALNELLNRALLANAAEIRIIHGLGTGKLLAATETFLQQTPQIKNHYRDPANSGVTVAWL